MCMYYTESANQGSAEIPANTVRFLHHITSSWNHASHVLIPYKYLMNTWNHCLYIYQKVIGPSHCFYTDAFLKLSVTMLCNKY